MGSDAETGTGSGVTQNYEPVLLVEDDADHARLVMKAFKDHGHLLNEIFWVKDGLEAMEFITQTGKYNPQNAPRPGLILLDLYLPQKNGFGVLEELKGSSDFKTIPVVVLTTTRNVDDVEKALHLGANDYIVKPVKFSEFVQKVGHLGHYWALISNAGIVAKKDQ